MSALPNLTLEEIRDSGILQEINRLLLHPRGLAMFVVLDAEDGERRLGIYADDDPEGWTFVWGEGDGESGAVAKAESFDALLKPDREVALGFVVQPLPEVTLPGPSEEEPPVEADRG